MDVLQGTLDMHNPIKRVWVPKKAQAIAAPVTPVALAIPAVPPVDVQQAPKRPRTISFDNEMPEPDVEEKNSDSIWAEFDSVLSPQARHK
jgi:hypothetical protein